jgi:hypothetical protein
MTPVRAGWTMLTGRVRNEIFSGQPQAAGGPVCPDGFRCMVAHMKTTVNLPDALLEEARQTARQRQTTVTSLIESGLRIAIARQTEARTFKLSDASVDGDGLALEFQGASWEQLRAAAYDMPA